jgi:hypothetical protein
MTQALYAHMNNKTKKKKPKNLYNESYKTLKKEVYNGTRR